LQRHSTLALRDAFPDELKKLHALYDNVEIITAVYRWAT
jgi:hypothetical protein